MTTFSDHVDEQGVCTEHPCSATPRLPILCGFSVLLVPAAGPALFFALVATGLRYGVLVGVLLVQAALLLEELALQRRWRDPSSHRAETAADLPPGAVTEELAYGRPLSDRSSDTDLDEH